MKTLTITISDEAAAALTAEATARGITREQLASSILEDAFDTSWLDELAPQDRDAIN